VKAEEWTADWDDNDTETAFDKQLRAELSKTVAGATAAAAAATAAAAGGSSGH